MLVGGFGRTTDGAADTPPAAGSRLENGPLLVYHAVMDGERKPGTVAILFENDDYIAVDKPEGVVSLAEAGRGGLPELLKERHPGRLYPVHRLDKEASGVIVFAKNAEAHRHLNQEFDRRRVKKTYLLVLHGRLRTRKGKIDKPIREFGSGRMGVDRARGKASLTEYEVVETLKDYTVVRAVPLTGRRHQLRVHFYSIGHPVVGDRRYGERQAQEAYPRLMLHALDIAFGLPSGEKVSVEAPVPPSFSSQLEALRRS